MKPISRLALTLFLPLCAFAQLPKDVVSKIDIKPKEIVVYAGENKMIFSAYPSDILQTTIETVSYKGEQISNAVINKGIFCPDVVRNDREALTLRSGKHWVRVDKQTGALQYGQQNGLFGLTGVESDSTQRKLRFSIQTEEQFFGTGSRSIALNKKGEYGSYCVQGGFNYAVHDATGNRLLDANYFLK
jgi:alpha-glucosidase (family GH31 glycosyl hydrolase)